MRTKLFILFILTLFLSTSCKLHKYSFLTNYQTFLSNEELTHYKNPEKKATKENYPEDDVVILYENSKTEIIAGNKDLAQVVSSTHKLKKIFSNINDVLSVSININYDEELLDLNARVIQPNDSIILLNKDDFIFLNVKFGDNEDSKRNEEKIIKLVFPNIKENSIIEYSFRTVKDFSYFGHSYPLEDENGTKIYSKYSCFFKPIEKETFRQFQEIKQNDIGNYSTTTFYSSFETLIFGFSYKFLGDTAYNNLEFKKENKNNLYSYEWTIHNLPKLKKEKNMPPDQVYFKRLSFNFLDNPSWKFISEYYNKRYYSESNESEKFTKSIFDSLIKDTKENYKKIEKITNYVKDIRYESIPLGRRGIIPQKPSKVIKKGYGDCKDKASLLIQFLKFMNIKAYPALLLTANKGILDKRYPLWNFNHMIVFISDSIYGEHWIDPTIPKSKYYQLPWVDEGVNALILGSKNDVAFLKTPVSDEDKNKRKIKIKLYNLDSAYASADIDVKFYGIEDLEFRNSFSEMTPKEKEENLKKLISSDFVSSKIDSIRFSDFNDYYEPFQIKFRLSSDRLILNQGNVVLLNYDVLAKNNDSEWNQTSERKYPVFIPYKSISEKETEIHYPIDKFKVNFLPDDFNENIEYCSYEKSFMDDNNGMIYCKSKYVENALSIPKEKFNIAKNFNLNINKYNQKRIIFEQIK